MIELWQTAILREDMRPQPDLPLGFKTRNGVDTFECLSALQKHIRRAEERQAMLVACELIHLDKQHCSAVCKRLQVISHEDIGTVGAVVFTKIATDQALEWYDADPKKIGLTRMVIGNAIRLLCREQKKSREGDHFQAAIGVANRRGELIPSIPDFALDKHTKRGRMMGRGLEHFRKEGAKLVPQPPPDRYEEEAYTMWAEEERRNKAERAARDMHIEEDD